MKTLAILLFLVVSIFGDSFTKSATTKPVFVQQGKAKHWCPICGMSIKKFYKTTYATKDRQFCSLRCLAVEEQTNKIDFKTLRTVDSKSEKLILAKDAFYVIDSIVSGTMSKVSKLAFEKKEDALKFIDEYEGELATFELSYKMAKESLKSDIAMTNKKKQKKMYPMGKKIFAKRCKQDIKIDSFDMISELKSALSCQNIKGKQLQAVALYLWEVKRVKGDKKSSTIKVSKDEKCPICGMFVYKYPRWVAQIFYKDSHLSFDGVKDMMKYYFDDKKERSKIVVTDYYKQKAIDAKSAYYVIGSDVYGPMGKELIPFKTKEGAKSFLNDHKGVKIVKFSEITKEEVYKLDE